jgi:hypothetical protein
MLTYTLGESILMTIDAFFIQERRDIAFDPLPKFHRLLFDVLPSDAVLDDFVEVKPF